MPKSFLSERSRGRCVPGAVPIATALALVFAACAHGIDNGLDFESSGVGPPSGGGTTIGATTGNAGPAVGSSGSGAGGRGGNVGGSGGMSGLAGSSVSTSSGTGGSIEDGGASTSGGAPGGNGGGGQGGTGGQAGMSGQGGSGGRDGGPPDGGGAGGSAGSTGGSGGVAGRDGAAGASGMGGAAGSVVVRDAGPLVSYDDSVVGTGNNQFNYAGTWGHCAPCTTVTTPPLFNTSNSWADGTTPATQIVSFAFVGSEILFYGVLDPRSGIGAISIDAGAETNIDFYAAARGGDHLLWTSPFLARGPHTLRLHPTGTMSAASTGITITVDRVEVH